ncbi:HAD-IA family hydrolase [Haloferax sp. DFSO52]|uniref:HAD-IA family hydrolase n=1 Tax=Haloferax sp. DFSO52 TaxID=3388505 RepID=UPI003A87909B
MQGRVSTGAGKAAGFVSSISDLVVEELGFDPFPGTFNLTGSRVADEFPSKTFRDIEEAGDVCEGVQFFECDVAGVHSAVIVPIIEGYPDDQIEILAPVSLRTVLDISDGDTIELTRRDDRCLSGGPTVTVDGLDSFDAVVFDLDQTLVDLEVDWDAVRADLDDLLGSYVSGDLFASESDLGTVARDNDVYESYLTILESAEVDGARHASPLTTLATLSELSSPLGVCTKNSVVAAEIALERFGVTDAVDVIVGRETLFEQKPHPKPLELCVSELGVRPGDAVFIGDDQRDCTAATRAGMSYFHPERLEETP